MNVPVLQPSQQAETPNFYYRKSPSAPEGAFGGSVANAVLNSADAMSSIAATEKHKADVQTVLDVSNQMTADLIKALRTLCLLCGLCGYKKGKHLEISIVNS